MTKVTLTLAADDLEPFLRQAAKEAAQYGSWCDYITRKTVDSPWSSMGRRQPFEDRRAEWNKLFLRAKRTVEAFGVEYEPVSESETMTVYIPDKVLKSHLVKVAGMTWRHIDKSVPDPKNARPKYRGSGVHLEACRQAADRVVKRWRQSLNGG